MIRPFEVAPTVLLAAILLLAPLPFGSVTLGWATVLRIGTFAALCLAMLTTAPHRRLRRLRWPVALIVALGAMGLLQTLHWPEGVIRFLSPRHLDLFARASEILEATSPPVMPSLTLSVADTRTAALCWLWAAAALATAAWAGLDRRRRRILGIILVGSAFGQVVFGIPLWLSRSTTIWGLEVAGDATRLRGTFVNADHLALFLELALAVCFAWGWWSFRRTQHERSLDRRFLVVLAPTFVGMVLFVGLALTGSRAGLAAALVALSGQGLLLALADKNWRLLPIGVVTAVAGLAAIVLLSAGQGFSRWIATSSYELTWSSRRFVYAETLDLWTRFPVLGTGLGSFEEAFPLVQSSRTSGFSWAHAHNAPLELLATTGLLGLAMVLVAFLATLSRLTGIHLRGYRTEDRATALAATGALMAVTFHEMFDFGTTIPANALALAVIVGAALGARTRASSGNAE